MLIVDETSDVKSSTYCVGAARQYYGTAGGIALCQVAVTLSYATPAGHALIDRTCTGRGWAADDERRELTGVPDEVMFATKPQLADALLAALTAAVSALPSSPAMRCTAAWSCAAASAPVAAVT